MDEIGRLLDGNWIDIGSAITAFTAALWRMRRSPAGPGRVTADFLNGAALFPFAVMMAGILSSAALQALKNAAPFTFFLAGGVGAIFVAAELRRA